MNNNYTLILIKELRKANLRVIRDIGLIGGEATYNQAISSKLLCEMLDELEFNLPQKENKPSKKVNNPNYGKDLVK